MLPDKDQLVHEMHRVLKANGKLLCAHYDWDSQLINGTNKSLVRKITTAYIDWKQPWMTDADSWMGRRLWGLFNRSKLFEGDIYTYVMTNTRFQAPLMGYQTIGVFKELVNTGLILEEEYESFYSDIVQLNETGEYFFSLTTYIYVGKKHESITR